MSAKKILQNVGLVLMVFAFVWVIFYISTFQSTPPTQAPTQENAGSITLAIEGLYERQSVSVSAGTTVLELLETLDTQDPAIKLSTKDYTGLGVLIDSIGELKNGTGGKYWQYRVNGVMPQVGAGAYVLKNGDSVEWFFAASQE